MTNLTKIAALPMAGGAMAALPAEVNRSVARGVVVPEPQPPGIVAAVVAPRERMPFNVNIVMPTKISEATKAQLAAFVQAAKSAPFLDRYRKTKDATFADLIDAAGGGE